MIYKIPKRTTSDFFFYLLVVEKTAQKGSFKMANYLKFLRYLFIAVVFIAFLIQIQESFDKYMEEMVTEQVSVENADALPLPPIALVTTTALKVSTFKNKTGKDLNLHSQSDFVNASILCPQEKDFHRCFKDYR